MTPAELLTSLLALPADTPCELVVGRGGYTLDDLRAAIAMDAEPVYITTEQASERFSRSPRWWADRAHMIEGAYKDRIWRLPVEGCKNHLAGLRTRKRTRRVPWKASSAQAASTRPPLRKAG